MAGSTDNQTISRRYARALFALAREQNQLEQVAADLSALTAMLEASSELQKFTLNATISRADQEITELDLEKAAKTARETAAPAFLNRDVLHAIPVEYRVDGAKVLGSPMGMKGVRLEVDYLFITSLSQHAHALAEAVEEADIEVTDQMASPLAGSYVTLTKDQKMKG